jgi:glycosyltransferase involved in cell wall biosynthesis
MNILFVHQNFPGQFRHVALALGRDAAHRVVAIGQPQAQALSGVTLLRYKAPQEPDRSATAAGAGASAGAGAGAGAVKSGHRYLVGMERAVRTGQQVARVMLDLQRKGFVPDVIVAHPGWGETLFARDIFPAARIIHFCEFYYHPTGVDVGFDPAFPVSVDDRARVRTRNALHLLNLEQCDEAVTPTHWQKSLHPAAYQAKLRVIHEGVDIHAAQPDPDASFALPDGRVLTRRDPVVTYVARNLEPYRGYPQFIRALATMQQRHPGLQALIIGGDEVSYGSAPEGHASWRERMAHEVPLDPARTHHVGRLTHRRYLDALRVGSAHVYLTYPFVLSWSALEAMACGCHLIGSATPPVQEVVEHGRNGWLTDFFDGDALARAVLDALAEPQRHTALRAEARRTVVERYSHEAGTRAWLNIILGPGQTPAEPA